MTASVIDGQLKVILTETETVKNPTQNDTAEEDTDKGVNVPLIICIALGVSLIGVGAYLVFFKKKKD